MESWGSANETDGLSETPKDVTESLAADTTLVDKVFMFQLIKILQTFLLVVMYHGIHQDLLLFGKMDWNGCEKIAPFGLFQENLCGKIFLTKKSYCDHLLDIWLET